MALRLVVPINAQETETFVAYLKDSDVKSTSFGKGNFPNPDYNKEDGTIPQSILRDYCKVTFNDLVEQEVPYEAYKMKNGEIAKGRNGKPIIEVKVKKETINNYQLIFDKSQFAYIEEFAKNLK